MIFFLCITFRLEGVLCLSLNPYSHYPVENSVGNNYFREVIFFKEFLNASQKFVQHLYISKLFRTVFNGYLSFFFLEHPVLFRMGIHRHKIKYIFIIYTILRVHILRVPW